MTYEEFRALPDFDVNDFKRGHKILYWDETEALTPFKVDYYTGHPCPLVLKTKENQEALMFRDRDIFRQIRMAPNDRYEVQIFISSTDIGVAQYYVVDTQALKDKEVGEFYSKEKADEYAKYLNMKEIVIDAPSRALVIQKEI